MCILIFFNKTDFLPMCISGVFPAIYRIRIRIHTRVLLLKNNKNIYRVDLKFEARPEVAAAQQADPAQSDIVR